MKKVYALFTLLMSFATMLPAQDLSWTVFNASNSRLSDNTVNDILVDDNNSKWFANGNGITTFDNTSWKQERINAPVFSLARDKAGNTWIGLNKGIIHISSAGKMTTYFPGPKLSAYKVTALAIDGKGNLWAGTEGGGIVMNPQAGAAVYNTGNSGIPSNIVTALEVDGNGTVWIGTELAGLASFNGSQWTIYNAGNSALPDNSVTSIAVDSKNNKWIGTKNGGLVKFDGTRFKAFNNSNSSIPAKEISVVEVDRNNTVWIGTQDGRAASFNGSTWKIYNSANAGLPGNEIISIAFDRANGVWFGTAAMGVARLCIAPEAAVTVSQLTSCEGNAVRLSANKGNYNYQWLVNGNPIAGATSATYNATATGNYSVIVSDSTACAAASRAVRVTVHPLPPAPSITQSGEMLASSMNQGNQWHLNGTLIAGATDQFYTPVQEGFYTVSVTDAHGCISTSAPFNYQPTRLEENKDEPLSAKVYPNPSSGMFNVQINNSEVKIQSLSLSDILGNMVWQENVSDRNNNEIDVEVTGMVPGVYFLNINTTERTFTKKISIR